LSLEKHNKIETFKYYYLRVNFMIIRQELVKRIKEYFDLNIYETKVWLALLSKGLASAGEVAELSEVPRSRTYDVLESLEKRGFAIAKIGKPVKYLAVKPTEVIEKMKSNLMQDAQERVKSLLV
jgi:sugar-specific transcriptional regulator TrmB